MIHPWGTPDSTGDHDDGPFVTVQAVSSFLGVGNWSAVPLPGLKSSRTSNTMLSDLWTCLQELSSSAEWVSEDPAVIVSA